MSTEADLYAGSAVLTGNAAKVRVLHDLQPLLAGDAGLDILDVGCVGLRPLELWEPLLDRYRFRLTGIDVAGIERAQEVIRRRGWERQVTLLPGSGYALARLFAPASFDVVVATQVLEHVARLSRFTAQVARVLRPGGRAFFTLDSAHWRPRFTVRHPLRFLKNVAKKGLSLIGHERRYDLPWQDSEVARACGRAGLRVAQCRYYNLEPLKVLHNHVLPVERKNAFLSAWVNLEDQLNEEPAVRRRGRHLFMGLYFDVRKPE